MSVEVRSAIPVLRVEDYPAARTFYQDKLRFSVFEEGGEPPRFGIFRRARGEVFINAWDGPDPRRDGGWRVYLHVDDAGAMAEELQSAGVEILRGPEDTTYGLREVEIEDPDGNRLCFGEILDD